MRRHGIVGAEATRARSHILHTVIGQRNASHIRMPRAGQWQLIALIFSKVWSAFLIEWRHVVEWPPAARASRLCVKARVNRLAIRSCPNPMAGHHVQKAALALCHVRHALIMSGAGAARAFIVSAWIRFTSDVREEVCISFEQATRLASMVGVTDRTNATCSASLRVVRVLRTRVDRNAGCPIALI